MNSAVIPLMNGERELSPIVASEDTTTETQWQLHPGTIPTKRLRIPTRPSLISIEGIPGSRKTELLNRLQDIYDADKGDVVILTEPIASDYNTGKEGTDILQQYLLNPTKYGFAFQIVYFLMVERQIRRAMTSNLTKRVMVCEKSLLSARHVFMEMLKDKISRVEKEVYDLFSGEGGVRHAMPDELIYLDSSIEKCLTEIANSKNEETVKFFNKEYLEECHLKYNLIATGANSSFHRVPADPDNIEETLEKVVRIISETREVEINQILPFEPERPRIVSIEGNVGAGKTSLLRDLRRQLESEGREDILVVEEPISKWTTITNGTDDILQLFYKDPAKYALTFQTMVAVTTMGSLHQAIAEHPEARVIVCERSLVSSRMIFAEALKNEGAMDETEMTAYDELFKDEAIGWMLPDEKIYLEVRPEICLERIRKRSRIGEQEIDLEWLRKYQSYHEEVLSGGMGNSPLIINGEAEGSDKRYEWVGQVIKWCDKSLEGVAQQPSDHYWAMDEESKTPPIGNAHRDTEVVVGSTAESTMEEEKENGISIKARYGNNTKCIGRSGDTLSMLTQRAEETFNETLGKQVHLAWIPTKGATPEIIGDDDQLQSAMVTMQVQGRPVARLIIITGEEHQL